MNRENSRQVIRSPHRKRPPLSFVVAPVLVFLIPGVVSAHGVVGNRSFLSPIVGNDAFPDNSSAVEVSRSDYAFSLMPVLEKQLTDNSSLLLTGGWARITPGAGGQEAAGLTDLSVYFRQAIYESVPHEMQLTLSPFLVLPVGDRQLPDQGYMHLGGEALLGKGLGDLPDLASLEYLRPLAVQVELGYAARVQGPANSDVVGNLELEYSIEYLNQYVRRLNIGQPWTGLVPYIQFNYAQSFIASQLTTSPDFRLTPGLAFLGDYCELSVGTQIAINGAAQSGDRVAVLGLAEIFYDDIFPALGWNPF